LLSQFPGDFQALSCFKDILQSKTIKYQDTFWE
jgi:hypothetical protein